MLTKIFRLIRYTNILIIMTKENGNVDRNNWSAFKMSY